MEIPAYYLDHLIDQGLAEDLPFGDVTTDLLAEYLGAAAGAEAVVKGKPILAAGLDVAARVFKHIDPAVEIRFQVRDGEQVSPGKRLFTLVGSARSLLAGERLALNFLQRLSGIATATNAFVRAVKGTGVKILDTRKTTPGLRLLEKYAVTVGGGHNHRFSLSDGILIKENHIAAAGGITAAMNAAQRRKSGRLLKVEIEVSNLDEVSEALRAGADMLLLDNFTPDQVEQAVVIVDGQAQLEVSGGVNLDNVRSYADAGPDCISTGQITHSSPVADISLLFLQ